MKSHVFISISALDNSTDGIITTLAIGHAVEPISYCLSFGRRDPKCA